jgi:hypothetical protein
MKKQLFGFFDTKNFFVFVVRGQFTKKKLKEIGKKKNIFQGQVEIISEKNSSWSS